MEKSRGGRSGRVAALVVVSVVSLVAFASLGGVGFAESAVGLGQYQYGKKVTICPKGKQAIRISVRAWPAHKRHGDTIGTCAEAKKKNLAKKSLAKKSLAKKSLAKKAHAEKIKQKDAERAKPPGSPKAGEGGSRGKSGKSDANRGGGSSNGKGKNSR